MTVFGRSRPEYWGVARECETLPIGEQALAGNRRRLSLLQKVLGETLAVLSSLIDQSMIQCLVLCVFDTAILLVLSAREQNMYSVKTT